MMYKYLVLIAFLSPLVSVAQDNPFEYKEEKPPLTKNEFSFGLNVHTSGWGFDFRRGWNNTVKKKTVIEAEIVNMKHPKEIRSVNPYFDNAKSFFYGKMNTLTVFRAGYGKRVEIFEKAEQGGVSVRLNYTVGPSFGFAKPVYLNILYPTAFEGEYQVVVEKYDPFEHYLDNIYGRASFTKGIGEMKIYPGLFGKVGISFDYGRHYQDVKIIEAGVTFDAYGKEIPIMAFAENSQFYLNFYINILYGRKW
jgi:hypothetical protein